MSGMLKNLKIGESPLLGISLSVSSGLLLFLSFTHLPYLSLISLIPLFFVIDNPKISLRVAFSYGVLCGLALYIPLLSFILVMEISVRFWLYLGVGILWLYVSIYYGVWCSVTKVVMERADGSPLWWILPSLLFVSLEFVRSLTSQMGFPWGSLGYTLVPQRYLMQIADITGIAGLSFLVICSNLLLYRLLSKRAIPFPLIAMFIIVIGYSLFRLDALKKLDRVEALTVSIIQPNVLPEIKRTGGLIRRAEILKDVSSRAPSAQLMIWPESALPGDIMEGTRTERVVREIVDTLGIPLIMGGGRTAPDGRIFNSAFLIKPDKGVIDFYDKIYLVPFGEKLPLDEYIPLLRRLQFGQGGFSPGEELTLFRINDLKFGVLICFEAIFPRYVRKFVRDGADFLVNITEDAWFGITPGPYEHARMASLRAVETRRTFIRCGNTGISYIATPEGEIKHRTGLFEEAIISDTIYTLPIQTFYTKYGDIFAYIMLIITLVGLWRVKLKSNVTGGTSCSTVRQDASPISMKIEVSGGNS
ncbi:apolipoprotein N-acyltransferase [candidate division WOR-3 bacterium]|nr:apolipoprotein N-acyltransferase [candidate division WOR-3 bacterium]